MGPALSADLLLAGFGRSTVDYKDVGRVVGGVGVSEDERFNEEAHELAEINDQMAVRRAKLEALRQTGQDPFTQVITPDHRAQQIVEDFDRLEGQSVTIAGRVRALREHGKATFADLQDGSGRVQLFVGLDNVGQEAYDAFRDLDLGDIIGVHGEVFRTRRGEISVRVVRFVLMAKALRPLPAKWHGLKDVEQRYRRRYLDLIVNPDVKRVFMVRSQIITSIRQTLARKGFIEVETPMLHPIPGGAAARPFETYHNALDMPLYLRIAPELYLKRLLVGGFERVYEMGKAFRNEGISTRHNPEYTLLEAYQAYASYEEVMALTEELIVEAARAVTGGTTITFQGKTIDLTPPWRRLSMLEAIREYAGIDFQANRGREVELARAAGVRLEENASRGHAIQETFEQLVEEHLIQPVFITDHPVEVSPLAKRKTNDPSLTERFEPYINGWEIANGFSELNDPDDQRQRFEEQARAREAGDDEAHFMDLDYVEALEYAMPPAGGLGIGIDRLTMLLTDSPSIREVILFPHMKPRPSR